MLGNCKQNLKAVGKDETVKSCDMKEMSLTSNRHKWKLLERSSLSNRWLIAQDDDDEIN